MRKRKEETMKTAGCAFFSGGLFFAFAFIILLIIISVRGCNFDWNCGEYLHRAARANTTEMAKAEVDKALDFATRNNLTKGNTGLIFTTPSNDLEFWYQNMTNVEAELSASANASQLEKTNILMKLRESIIEQGEKEENLKLPANISLYPYQTILIFGSILALILLVGCIVLFFVIKSDD